MIQRYRPKNKYYIEGWLMTHQHDKQVIKQDGRLSYLGLTSETFGILRNLTESLDYYFERVDWNKYQLKNDFGNKQSTTIAEYTIHDDLMELIVDDEADILPQILPDLFLNEEQSDAPSVVDETHNVKHDILRLLDDLHKIAMTCVTMLLKKEDK